MAQTKHKKKHRPDKRRQDEAKEAGGGIGYCAILTSIAVVGLAYAWGVWQAGSLFFHLPGGATTTSKSSATSVNIDDLTPLERLMHYWPSGGAVTVKSLTNGTVEDRDDRRGLVATKKIRKGKVALVTDYVDLEAEISELQPELPALVEEILKSVIQEQGAKFATLTTKKVLALTRFLELVDIEKVPKWTAYAETLPRNVTNKAWYWTEEERKCIVPRPDDEMIFQNLNVFRGVIAKLAEQNQLVRQIYTSNPKRAEWAYLMMTTRGFGDLFFVPILDMTNHDPLQAVPTFFLRDKSKIYLVAPQTIQPGEPVYNHYGPLSSIQSAEGYGFVQSAYFASPSIHRDMWRSANTNTIPHCTKGSVQFFGNVGDQVVEAALGEGPTSHRYSVYFKEFMPTKLAFACIRVLIQSEQESTIAKYVAHQLEADYKQYAIMADADHCQSTQGNFPLIRQANQVTASLMWEAYEVAAKAANNASIPYTIEIPADLEEKEEEDDDGAKE